jgi:hypothetical protein
VEQALRDAKVDPRNIDYVVFVGGPTRMPFVRAFFEKLLGRTAESGIDPMECVACGAAIQAGVLAGQLAEIVLVDVTPLTLGVETLGGVATALIARNTSVPVKHTEIFTTAADIQTSVTIHVFQGERSMAADNTTLGQFNLDGLPPAPRGIPKIDVTFDLDTSGILDVSAKDTATGKSQSIRITGSTRLSPEEKQRMVDEAGRYGEEDRKRREQAEMLNSADSTCYQAEQMLAEHGGKLSADHESKIEAALHDVREALSKRDAKAASDRGEELKRLMQEAGATLYAQTSRTGTQAGPSAVPGPQEKTAPSGTRVVDAEFREKAIGFRAIPDQRRDYYEVLGVSRNADAKAIRDAFRTLALRYHADRNKEPGAEERFKEIAEAYAVLSDDNKRAAYDAGGFTAAGIPPEDLFAGINFDELFRGAGLGFGEDLFDRFFRRRRDGPARGEDLEATIEVPLDKIARGGEKSVHSSRLTTCSACNGTGAAAGTTPRNCELCHGSGEHVSRKQDGAMVVQYVTACSACHGAGTMIEKPCSECS